MALAIWTPEDVANILRCVELASRGAGGSADYRRGVADALVSVGLAVGCVDLAHGDGRRPAHMGADEWRALGEMRGFRVT